MHRMQFWSINLIELMCISYVSPRIRPMQRNRWAIVNTTMIYQLWYIECELYGERRSWVGNDSKTALLLFLINEYLGELLTFPLHPRLQVSTSAQILLKARPSHHRNHLEIESLLLNRTACIRMRVTSTFNAIQQGSRIALGRGTSNRWLSTYVPRGKLTQSHASPLCDIHVLPIGWTPIDKIFQSEASLVLVAHGLLFIDSH